ncbi:MAG: TsaC protein (YrdC domain) required for threonylcarbamoyladenosine t(6)A37 modification in tRNA [uncultured Sulfurovum sp.]|uniref:TsaC protein (YrdC domain) required for threonylcarbamoyladenosine t(6)A37 modification in tRNA n=1 Tax=uncultured Sulfurovum sp. TaxID=269237 RepID=A0A6S6T1Q1_9BACT|nr:MAG: TsaC protein (YrdC domain) required for threonylcarbamoyladenosine t(6)A37 modification in tRNA [uncultured Sulfurovum sp.]
MQTNLFLTQTDTTIGFVSQDSKKIDQAKKRKPNKHYIKVVNSLETLKRFSRVPNKYKNAVRRAKRTTFIMPNGLSFRVVKNTEHNLLLDRLYWVYSSSANLSGAEYDEAYAKENTEVLVSFPKKKDRKERKASRIYKLSQNNIRSIR